MSYFAVVLSRVNGRWSAAEVKLDDCESAFDVADLIRDVPGQVRLLAVEQDDEYAVLARLDHDEDDLQVFLSNGHAADEYPMAEMFAENLDEIGGDDLSDDEDAPYAHDTAPFGDASVVADLGTSAAQLLALCAHEGTLPIDLLAAVCEAAGCLAVFEAIQG